MQQSPENQIVTDKVWHELAFGLESLGYDTPTIRRRVAEMASFFGIQTWFYKSVTELSGGQKQLLNLASVMVLQPKVLILDEPTSQLDPIAASDFLATLGKINRELGTTIILTEHRLEEAFSFASRVAVMDGGRLLCSGTPAEVGAELKSSGNAMFLAMPAAMRIWAATDSKAVCPISVCDGRNWLLEYAKTHELKPIPEENKNAPDTETVVSAREIWFKYDKDLPDVVKGLSLELHKGEFLALLGGNGTGKTTTLKLLAGLKKRIAGNWISPALSECCRRIRRRYLSNPRCARIYWRFHQNPNANPSGLHRSFRSASWRSCLTAIPTIFRAANSSAQCWRKSCF